MNFIMHITLYTVICVLVFVFINCIIDYSNSKSNSELNKFIENYKLDQDEILLRLRKNATEISVRMLNRKKEINEIRSDIQRIENILVRSTSIDSLYPPRVVLHDSGVLQVQP